MNRRKLATFIVVGAAVASMSLTGCSSGGSASTGDSSSGVTLNAVLWDPIQLPIYQQCAAGFKAKTGITIKYKQIAFQNYWSNLTTEMAAGTAPDIFTDHVAHFPTYQKAGELVNLSPYFKKDGYKVNQYGIATNKLWNVGGKQYALSQAKDVEGLLYNTKDIPTDTPTESLSNLTFNSSDGGSFGKLVEHLTVDAHGNRGDSPDFDKSDVKTYGFALTPAGGASGQSSWSPLLLSTGWNYLNKNPFGTEYHFADKKSVAFWTWVKKMYDDGYIAPPKLIGSLGLQPLLDKNTVAMSIQGSWLANSYLPTNDSTQTYAWAQLPSGSVGHPTSITNSTGPSVTSSSKHPAEAAKWVEYVVSPACANVVAKSGVIIPSVPEGSAKALAVMKKQGIDTKNWEELFNTPENLRLFPITTNGSEIDTLANTAIDTQIPGGGGSAKTIMTQLNSDVNKLLSDQ